MIYFENMRILITLILEEIIRQYNRVPLATNSYIYLEIRKCMYNLPIFGKFANDELKNNLASRSCTPVAYTSELWKYSTNPLYFPLITCCRWLYNKISNWGTCWPCTKIIDDQIHYYRQLAFQNMLRYHLRLRLSSLSCAYFHAQVCWYRFYQINIFFSTNQNMRHMSW